MLNWLISHPLILGTYVFMIWTALSIFIYYTKQKIIGKKILPRYFIYVVINLIICLIPLLNLLLAYLIYGASYYLVTAQISTEYASIEIRKLCEFFITKEQLEKEGFYNITMKSNGIWGNSWVKYTNPMYYLFALKLNKW